MQKILVVIFFWLSAFLYPAPQAWADTGLFQEIPSLKNPVESRELPPIQDRLPTPPFIISPHETGGEYSEKWIVPYQNDEQLQAIFRNLAHTPLISWNRDHTRIIPVLAQSFSVNDDQTRFSFKLRKGTRWSDGRLFSTNDIGFWFNDIMLDSRIMPRRAYWLNPDDHTPPELIIHSSTDFEIQFERPAPLFLKHLASPQDNLMRPTYFPFHWFKQYHPTHTPFAASTNWAEKFKELLFDFSLIERPTFAPWVLQTGSKHRNGDVLLTRNPYFPMTDLGHNQLPYFDNLQLIYTPTVYALNNLLRRASIGLHRVDHQSDYPDWAALFPLPLVGTAKEQISLFMNTTTGHKLSAYPIRQGVIHSTERRRLTRKVLKEGAFTPQIPFNIQTNETERLKESRQVRYSPELARRLLQQNGLRRTVSVPVYHNEDGIRLDLTFIVEASNKRNITLAQEIAYDWSRFGIEAIILPLSAKDYRAAIASGTFDVLFPSTSLNDDLTLSPSRITPTEWSFYVRPPYPLTPTYIAKRTAQPPKRFNLNPEQQITEALDALYYLPLANREQAFVYMPANLFNFPRNHHWRSSALLPKNQISVQLFQAYTTYP